MARTNRFRERYRAAALLALQGSFALCGVVLLEYAVAPWHPLPMLGNSLGALAILLLALPSSCATRTSTVLVSHVLGAVCGVLCRLGIAPWSPVFATLGAIGLTLFVLHVLDVAHPPAGAVALWAVHIDATSSVLPWVLVTPVIAAAAFLASNGIARRLLMIIFARKNTPYP